MIRAQAQVMALALDKGQAREILEPELAPAQVQAQARVLELTLVQVQELVQGRGRVQALVQVLVQIPTLLLRLPPLRLPALVLVFLNAEIMVEMVGAA